MAGPKERGTKIPKPLAKIFTGLHGKLYKLSGGRIGSKMQDGLVVLLGTTGAKSGKARTSPLIAIEHGDGWALVASFSGHDVHPGWYHNLVANPEATIQIGREITSVRARTVEGEERTELWDRFTAVYGDYEKYARVTDREIPLVALERV